jgi:Relaxase/Mobilisation nuclease domain
MIGKQIKGTSFRGVLNYLHGKEGAELVGSNMSGQEPRTLAAGFRLSRELNSRVKRAVYHSSLSLPKTEQLDDGVWMAIAQDYLQGMGFEDCQFVVYRHTDQDHDHIHIVASRIRLTDGKTVSDSWDYRRSESLIRTLEQNYQLEAVIPSWQQDQRAPTTGESRFVERTGILSVRRKLQVLLNEIVQSKFTMPQVIQQLQRQGVNVRVRQTRSGIRGISYEMEGIAFSGTKLGRAFTFPGLQRHRGIGYEPERDDLRIQSLIENVTDLRSPQMSEPSQLQSEGADRFADSARVAPFAPTLSKKERYQQMWQRYSQGVVADNPKQFDFRVCREAFKDGQSPKDVGLMLAAGSPYVAEVRRERGSEEAKAYVSRMSKKAFLHKQQAVDQKRRQFELD